MMKPPAMPHIPLDKAKAAKRSAFRRFEKLGKVTGVGITRVNGEYALKVNLSEPVEPGTELPTDIDGVPVRVEITGTIRAR
jgi:hypothetical protein